MQSMYMRGPPHEPYKHKGYNLYYDCLRDRIFEHLCFSADHVAQIIFDDPEVTDKHIIEYCEEKRIEFPVLFSGKGRLPRDRIKQIPVSPNLELVLYKARGEWAQFLCNEDLRDVDIVLRGSWAQCEIRFQFIKNKLTKAGGRPYFQHGYDKETETMCFGIVVSSIALDEFRTPEAAREYDVQIFDNTVPAPFEIPIPKKEEPDPWPQPEDGTKRPRPQFIGLPPAGCKMVVGGAVRKVPKRQWYKFPSSDCKQPTWDKSSAPFTSDYSDNNLTDCDWWLQDHEKRAAMLKAWGDERTERRLAQIFGDDSQCLSSSEFTVMPGLCNTYPPSKPQETVDRQGAETLQELNHAVKAKEPEYIRCKQSFRDACRTLEAAQKNPLAHPALINQLQRNVDFHTFHRVKAHFTTLQSDLNSAWRGIPKASVDSGYMADPETHRELRQKFEITPESDQAVPDTRGPVEKARQTKPKRNDKTSWSLFSLSCAVC